MEQSYTLNTNFCHSEVILNDMGKNRWHKAKTRQNKDKCLCILCRIFYIDMVRCPTHYSDVIMDAIASQTTYVSIVYSIVSSGFDQRKHESSASQVFVRGIHRCPVISQHTKAQLRGKFFNLMTSSCKQLKSLQNMPPSCRRPFQMQRLEWSCANFD